MFCNYILILRHVLRAALTKIHILKLIHLFLKHERGVIVEIKSKNEYLEY